MGDMIFMAVPISHDVFRLHTSDNTLSATCHTHAWSHHQHAKTNKARGQRPSLDA